MCAQLMASEVFQNTLSCAPMEPSLTKLISFVIGGLTLIVLKPKDSTVGTTRSQLNNKLFQQKTQLQLTHQILTLATLPPKHLLMITQQEKDVKAADKEDADKEDVEETKAQKIPSNSHSLFQIIEKELSCLTHERNQPRILSNYPPLLKQNSTPCHQNHEYQSFLA